jgi:hypothetical protein
VLTELLGVVVKIKTQPLLVAFITLSAAVLATGGAILADPFSWQLLTIPFFGLFTTALVFGWFFFVHSLNSRLAENDIASWGPMIGSVLLTFCLLVAFSYLAAHPHGLSFALLGEPGFIYFCTLLLLAAETMKISRRKG